MVHPEVLNIYVVYCRPKDYPNHYVVGRWDELMPYVREYKIADSLNAARNLIPQGLIRMDRSPEDDPTIVESWL